MSLYLIGINPTKVLVNPCFLAKTDRFISGLPKANGVKRKRNRVGMILGIIVAGRGEEMGSL